MSNLLIILSILSVSIFVILGIIGVSGASLSRKCVRTVVREAVLSSPIGLLMISSISVIVLSFLQVNVSDIIVLWVCDIILVVELIFIMRTIFVRCWYNFGVYPDNVVHQYTEEDMKQLEKNTFSGFEEYFSDIGVCVSLCCNYRGIAPLVFGYRLGINPLVLVREKLSW